MLSFLQFNIFPTRGSTIDSTGQHTGHWAWKSKNIFSRNARPVWTPSLSLHRCRGKQQSKELGVRQTRWASSSSSSIMCASKGPKNSTTHAHTQNEGRSVSEALDNGDGQLVSCRNNTHGTYALRMSCLRFLLRISNRCSLMSGKSACLKTERG